MRVTDVILRAPRGDRGGEEHGDVPELVVPRRGVFVLHRGGRTLVADPTTAFVLRDEYRVSHPCGGGDHCPECGSEHFFLCPVRSKRGDR